MLTVNLYEDFPPKKKNRRKMKISALKTKKEIRIVSIHSTFKTE